MGAGYIPEDLPLADQPAILITRRAASSDFNPLYYNPRVRYSPAVQADGTPLHGTDGNADFNAAWRDVFSTNGGCQIDLAHHYVAVWQETVAPCSADDAASNVYLVDPLNLEYLASTPPTDVAAFAKNWAADCLSVGHECPAYYYVYDPLNGDCDGNKETDACYTRVVVGTEPDLSQGGFSGCRSGPAELRQLVCLLQDPPALGPDRSQPRHAGAWTRRSDSPIKGSAARIKI